MLTKEERGVRLPAPSPRTTRAGLGAALIALVAGCGGGTPLGNPPDIQNNGGSTGGRSLSFAYFQRCINPIFGASLPIIGSVPPVSNTCGSAGCHDDANGTGGAFRIRLAAPYVPSGTAEATVRASDMYKNYISAQGEVTFNSILLSRLITKPLVRGVLHGGGQIFLDDDNPNVKKIVHWMRNPIPIGQSEFTTDLADITDAPACPTPPP